MPRNQRFGHDPNRAPAKTGRAPRAPRAQGAAPRSGSNASPSAPPLRLGANAFVAHTQPGLEVVAWSEIVAKVEGASEIGRRGVPERNGMVIFSAPRPDLLARLRTIEDVFALVGYRRPISADRTGLEQARTAVRNAPNVEQGLAARVRLMPGRRAGRRLSFRVVA